MIKNKLVSKKLGESGKKKAHYPWASEGQLWKDFKSGNKIAFSHIYKNYFNVIYDYGCKIINDKELVKDSIQDLFYEIWESKDRLSDTDSIKYYLLKSIRIKIFKKINQQNKHYTDVPSHETNFNLVATPHETRLIEEQGLIEQKKRLSNIIAKLSKRQREAIYLRFFNDFTYNEISSIMSISHQSVHNLIYQALKVLRNYLTMGLTLLHFLKI